ncbi:hypothetical protein [Streptomyces sp. NPDC001380]|uniref:hypothetical protein n=1 Tax=Streptomyces sp. NPDC001380 TaxID=3364566 RepID=UPI0036A44B95
MGRRRQEALSGGPVERPLTGIDGGRALRPAPGRGPAPAPGTVPAQGQGAAAAASEQGRLWHVVLSVAGRSTPLPELRSGLERLVQDHPFLLTARYAADHAEVRYWEQARDLHDAAAIALRLWGEHRATAGLPAWEIVGLEVVDRETYLTRAAQGHGGPPAPVGGVHPY